MIVGHKKFLLRVYGYNCSFIISITNLAFIKVDLFKEIVHSYSFLFAFALNLIATPSKSYFNAITATAPK